MFLYEGVVARVHVRGDALTYPTGPEYRTRESLATIPPQLPNKPVVLLHPAPAKPHWGLISKGAPADDVGFLLPSRLDGDEVVARVLVDERGWRAIQDGTHELSLGYSCRLDADRNQVDIEIDHLALVPKARCGGVCALRVDAAAVFPAASLDRVVRLDCEGYGLPETANDPATGTCPCKSRAMPHNVSDMHAELTPAPTGSVQGDLPGAPALVVTPSNDEVQMEEMKAQLEAARADADKARVAIAAAEKAQLEAEKAKLDAEKSKLESDIAATNARKDAEAEKVRADKAIEDLAAANARADQAETAAKAKLDAAGAETLKKVVADRVAVIVAADRILGALDDKGARIDRSDIAPRDLKVAIIKAVDGDDVHADAVDAYVDGIFDGAVRRFDRAKGSVAAVRGALQAQRQDGAAPKKTARELEAEASERAATDRANAWH